MSSLTEFLTILIAFSVIMLVLSMIVTALVQGIQSAVGLRSRNLRNGLADLIEVVLAEAHGTTREPRDAAPDDLRTKAGELAKRYTEDIHLLQGRAAPTRLMRKIAPHRGWTSWVTRQELYTLLAAEAEVPWGDPAAKSLDEGRLPYDPLGRALSRWFDRFEANQSKDFLARVRWVTFVCSLGVAALFQVDAVQTLAHLSSDPEARDRFAAAAGPLLDQVAEDLEELGDPRAAVGEALALLEEENPEVEEAIESVSGESGDWEEVEDDLRSVLVDGETEREVLEDFDRLRGEITTDRAERAARLGDVALGHAARLDLTPWPHGMRFYFDGWKPRGRCLLGVLLTTLLLSLGAPFWFNQLRTLVNLRDKLSTLAEKKDGEADTRP